MSQRAMKEDIVKNIVDGIDKSRGVIISDYRGLNVGDLTMLRKQLSGEEIVAKVFKNTLTRRALSELKLTYPKEMLLGPNLIVRTENDVVKMSKILVDFAKDNENLTIKGGFLSKDYIDGQAINQLAKLIHRNKNP